MISPDAKSGDGLVPLSVPADRAIARPIRLEWAYLVLALVFGSAFLILTPPFQAPDEEFHFRRAFAFSEGRVVCLKQGNVTGDYQPRGLSNFCEPFSQLANHVEQKTSFETIRSSSTIHYDSSEREFVAFSNAAIHPPLVYVSQAAGVLLARSISSSVLVCFYAGRLWNLVVAAIVTFLAIRILPVGKCAMLCFALTPMALFLTASFSPDALTNSLSFLLLAQVLACALRTEGRVSNRALVALVLSGAAVGLAKQAYFLLPLCYLMIPIGRVGTTMRYWSALAMIICATLLAVGGWGIVVRGIYSPADVTKGIDAAEQLRLMYSDPVEFGRVLLRTSRWSGLLVEEYVGVLGQLDTHLPLWLCVIEMALLGVVCVREFGPWSGVTVRQAFVAAAVALLVSLTVLVVMHVTWDKVGWPVIVVQGRYFIPALPLAGIAFGRAIGSVPVRIEWLGQLVPRIAVLSIAAILTIALAQVHVRYFVDNPEAAAERAFGRAQALQKKGGSPQQTRGALEEAVKLDPKHFRARFVLGQLLLESRPDEAIKQFREALRQTPDNVEAINNIAAILYRDADYSEAVRLYQEAARLAPDNVEVKKNLARAAQADEHLSKSMERISTTLSDLARHGLLEDRHAGTAATGLYFKLNRGRVADAAGKSPFPQEFVWRCPPPSGDEISLPAGNAAREGDARRRPFYACSLIAAPKRVFVFAAPRNAVILPDAAVSWYFQVPLSDLNENELQQEDAYRRSLGLSFPLVRLPE